MNARILSYTLASVTASAVLLTPASALAARPAIADTGLTSIVAPGLPTSPCQRHCGPLGSRTIHGGHGTNGHVTVPYSDDFTLDPDDATSFPDDVAPDSSWNLTGQP